MKTWATFYRVLLFLLLSPTPLPYFEIEFIKPILQMRKTRLREVK